MLVTPCPDPLMSFPYECCFMRKRSISIKPMLLRNSLNTVVNCMI
uniref:Uncharacterized protein n=1 Tax=Anguilla anguilla TaxID=7936 RepID=A0A0E9U7S8_ANGAN